MERGHDYVDYDSPDVFCSKFLGVLLCSTNETLGFLFENFSEASGPEIIRLEKLGFFRRVSLVEKG